MKEIFRTHTCNDLTISDLEKEVVISGFVSSIRDHGGVKFIDLKDNYGITQIVVHDETVLKGISKESVIKVEGKVIKRDEDTINEKIKTGLIEVELKKLTLLSKANLLPF